MMPNLPVSRGARGADVRRCQELLGALGFSLPATEMRSSYYGDATRDAVAELQRRGGLAPNGVFDEAAAVAGAAVLAKRVLVLPPPPSVTAVAAPVPAAAAQQLEIHGRAVASGYPVPGVKVFAYDMDLRGFELLNPTAAITD